MKSCSSDVIQVSKEGEEASSLLVVPNLESNSEEWKTIQMLLSTCIIMQHRTCTIEAINLIIGLYFLDTLVILVGKNMPPLFSVLSFVLCFECNIFGATLYVHRCITVQLTFFCEKHLKYQIFFNKYKSSLSKNI